MREETDLCHDEHSYGAFHHLLDVKATEDDITCSRCGVNVIWDEELGWWKTKALEGK